MILVLDKKRLICWIGIFVLGVIGSIFLMSMRAKTTSGEGRAAYIALVIDDLGNQEEGTDELLTLGIPITVAVMPFRPFSKKDAEEAHKRGMEVILHVPMEPVKGKPEWLGPKGITTQLSNEQIWERLQEGLNEIPHVVGMNNHMGSKAMADQRVVTVLLEFAKDKKLFFLDSKTTMKSAASQIAKDLEVCYFERDVFLDHVKHKKEIRKSLEELGDIALNRGYAIGIGHVGEQGGKITMEQIKSMIPILEKRGIQFIHLSQIYQLEAYQ